MEPSSAAFCTKIAAASAARGPRSSLEEMRAGYDALMKMMFEGRGLEECVSSKVEIPGVLGGGVLYLPRSAQKTTDVLIYFHGGGFVQGSVDGYASVTSHLAAGSGAAVLSVEYRLAPEHKAPAAAEDAAATLRFVCSGVGKGPSSAAAAALGVAGIDSVGVAGDSAGGNLAAVAALTAAQEGLPLQFQLLLFPWVDALNAPGAHGPSHLLFAENHLLTKASMDFFYDCTFVGDVDIDVADWVVSPIAAPAKLMRDAAPALIVTADHDLLANEGKSYSQKLAASGCESVEYREYAKQFHTFMHFGKAVKQAAPALEETAASIRRLFAARRIPKTTAKL